MNFGNLMLAIGDDFKSMDIVGWITVVVAVLGLCLFFSDLIINIKKRRNTRLNIIGLVFISLSLVCFVMTMLFSDMELIFMFISLAFMVGYFVCDVIVALCIAKQNKREGKPIWRKPKKKAVQEDAEQQSDSPEQQEGAEQPQDGAEQPQADAEEPSKDAEQQAGAEPSDGQSESALALQPEAELVNTEQKPHKKQTNKKRKSQAAQQSQVDARQSGEAEQSAEEKEPTADTQTVSTDGAE